MYTAHCFVLIPPVTGAFTVRVRTHTRVCVWTSVHLSVSAPSLWAAAGLQKKNLYDELMIIADLSCGWRLTCHGANCDYCIFTAEQILSQCRYRLKGHLRYSQGDGVARRGENTPAVIVEQPWRSIWPSLWQAAPLLPWEGSGSWATWGSFIQPVNTLVRALQRMPL